MIEIRRNPSTRELRLFAALIFPAFWTVVALLLHTRLGWSNVALTIAVAAVCISIAGFVEPRFMRLVYLGMIMATYPIGFVVSHILLAVVYYVVFTGVAVLLRLLGRDPMNRKLEPSAPTYWLDREATADTERYFRQY